MFGRAPGRGYRARAPLTATATTMPKLTPRFRQRRHTLAALLLLGLGAAIPIIASPISRSASATGDRCAVPAEFAPSGAALPHTAARLARGGTLTIVALGSSSTEGV